MNSERGALLDHGAPIRASGDTCVYVIGMHRSGTSAVSGLLSHLGLGQGMNGALVESRPASHYPFYWEDDSLTDFDERLLGFIGGSWKAPPALSPDWVTDHRFEPFRSEALTLFTAAFGERPISWKDPRLSILLPFWRIVVKPPFAAIFVIRDPSEVTASLQVRDGLLTTHGFALCERYVRAAARSLDGIPTFVLSYRTLLESAGESCEQLVAFLKNVAVTVDRSCQEGATNFIDAERRHEKASDHSTIVPPQSTSDLFEAMMSKAGEHHPWVSPNLGEEPGWVLDTLATFAALDTMNDRYAALEARYAALEASFPFGFAKRLKATFGKGPL